MSAQPQSVIYMPLIAKERVLGIVSIQSFKKHAYTDHHLNVIRRDVASPHVAEIYAPTVERANPLTIHVYSAPCCQAQPGSAFAITLISLCTVI